MYILDMREKCYSIEKGDIDIIQMFIWQKKKALFQAKQGL